MPYTKTERAIAAATLNIVTTDFQLRLQTMKANGATLAEILNASVDQDEVKRVHARMTELFGGSDASR